jgi:hypothetical protein
MCGECAQLEKERIKTQLAFEAEQRTYFAEEQRKFLEEMMAQQRALRAQVTVRPPYIIREILVHTAEKEHEHERNHNNNNKNYKILLRIIASSNT